MHKKLLVVVSKSWVDDGSQKGIQPEKGKRDD